MDKNELESILKEAGLSGYQSDVFISLLWLQEATVSEIVETCSVPQPRIYDVLGELDEKGYIETYEEESLRARVHDPSIIVSDLNSKADRFHSAADRIETVWEKPPMGQHKISVFNDFKRIVNHAADCIEDAENSIQIAVDIETYVDLMDPLRKAKQNDVHIKISIREDPSFRFDIDDIEGYFDETASIVKKRYSTAPFIALIDGNDAYFGLKQSPVDSYGVMVNDQAMSSMMYWFYQNSLWEIWDVIFTDDTDRKDAEYTEIRQCIRDITPLVAEGETVEATVYGYDIKQDRQREISGEIVDTIAPDNPLESDPQNDVFTGRTTILLDAGEDEYSVGGFGAILEDIRATRIVLASSPSA